jgi:AcrR family transcriptional regulator
MSRRNTKEEIILATLELASENGLKSVSMQQIADRVGIRKASLYNHFSSKEEIIAAMYESIRQSSKRKADIVDVDYGALARSGTMREVLSQAVGSYLKIVSDPQMNLFYRVIMNERSVDKTASEIMVTETRAMIRATTELFRALQDSGKAEFDNIDSAAFVFAMAVHSTIDYGFDMVQAGEDSGEDMVGALVDEFCRNYGPKVIDDEL